MSDQSRAALKDSATGSERSGAQPPRRGTGQAEDLHGFPRPLSPPLYPVKGPQGQVRSSRLYLGETEVSASANNRRACWESVLRPGGAGSLGTVGGGTLCPTVALSSMAWGSGAEPCRMPLFKGEHVPGGQRSASGSCMYR